MWMPMKHKNVKNADVPLHKIWEFKPQHCDVAIFLIGVNLNHLPPDKEEELQTLKGYLSSISYWTSTFFGWNSQVSTQINP